VIAGLLHGLLGLATPKQLEEHPKVGASWEGYALEEAIKAVRPEGLISGRRTTAPNLIC
jgi:hypothetical protein